MSTPLRPARSTWCLTGLLTLCLTGCGGGGSSSTTETSSTTTTPTSPSTGASVGTAAVACGVSASEFNSSASVNQTATYSWTCSSTARTLSANGLPNHATGTFPNANNPNAITAQVVSANITLSPTSTSTVTAVGGPVTAGYLLNGVKIDPNTAGSCTDAGVCSAVGGGGSWSLEALNSGFNFGTDSNNAHVQPGGAYHYHGMPEGYITKLGKGQAMTLIGWAADGFPIYARYGYSVATDANSAVRVMKGSYQLKTTVPANRPSTAVYKLGTFQQDYEYVAGSGDLDECNGRTGVTPEFPNGTYHYYATDSYPFMQRCVKGKL